MWPRYLRLTSWVSYLKALTPHFFGLQSKLEAVEDYTMTIFRGATLVK